MTMFSSISTVKLSQHLETSQRCNEINNPSLTAKYSKESVKYIHFNTWIGQFHVHILPYTDHAPLHMPNFALAVGLQYLSSLHVFVQRRIRKRKEESREESQGHPPPTPAHQKNKHQQLQG
eukprot:GHVL01020047.1.p2 GENE.GHVL01020047.1~~GHVL01020047.1.p2  ORF type:complete len:121 (-),score=11.23 GHVL01020047.1:427-789(-)